MGNRTHYAKRLGGSRVVCRRAGRAMTLIELVVALTAASVLLMAVFPALTQARQRSREVACADTLANFGRLLTFYTTDYEDWLPGQNTSGLPARLANFSWGGGGSILSQSDLPVQSQDWMTPLVSYEETLPANRADRFYRLLTRYGCPQQDATTALYAQSGVPDLNDFVGIEWPATSYQMPAYMQLWGTEQRELLAWTSTFIPIYSRMVNESWEVLETDYRSRIDEVGTPAGKIFVADGTRYVNNPDFVTLDIGVDPGLLGAFSDFGGWWSGSPAYGVAEGSLNWAGTPVSWGSYSDGANLSYSYRHRCLAGTVGDGTFEPEHPTFDTPSGRTGISLPVNHPAPWPTTAQDNRGCINAVFFDGHVEAMSDRQSREIELWYPSGGVVQSPEEGMTAVPTGYVIP